ncbi:MAG: ATP-binding cassette domain-containing protein [Cytophagales bacterium]
MSTKTTKILKSIFLEVRESEVVALIGRNGAGKSSILRTSVGLIDGFEGEVIKRPKLSIGYLPEERGLYKNETVRENLSFFHQLQTGKSLNNKALLELVEQMSLPASLLEKKTKELSKGQQQKVQWLLAVAHHPELIVLDEPFSGYDPENSEWLISQIKILCKKGVGFLVSSHRLDYMERLSDRLYCVNSGEIVAQGTFDSVFSKQEKNEYIMSFSEKPAAIDQKFKVLENWQKSDFYYHIKLSENQKKEDLFAFLLEHHSSRLVSVTPYRKNSHQVFQEIMPL